MLIVQNEVDSVLSGVFTVQVGAPKKTKQGQRLVTLGVSKQGAADASTVTAMNQIHQMDSLLDLKLSGA